MTKPSVVARESQHTVAVPVHIEQNPYNKHEILIVDSGNDRFASVHKAQPHAEESAEFIVRACNAHQALHEALQAAYEVMGEAGSDEHVKQLSNEELGKLWTSTRLKAEQALRLAQGEK